MKILLAAIFVLSLLSCNYGENRTSVTIKNASNHPVKMRVKMGIFMKVISIKEGGTYEGYLDSRMVQNLDLYIIIE